MSKIFTYCPGTDVWGEAALLPSPVVSDGRRQFPNRSNTLSAECGSLHCSLTLLWPHRETVVYLEP